MKSYITAKGCLVFHYNPALDDFEIRQQEAIRRHGLEGRKVTTIAVTERTDFLQKEREWTT